MTEQYFLILKDKQGNRRLYTDHDTATVGRFEQTKWARLTGNEMLNQKRCADYEIVSLSGILGMVKAHFELTNEEG